MNDYTQPIYQLDRKDYKSIAGLMNALCKKHKADGISGVSSDRKIKVFQGRDSVCAVYAISNPEIGKPMILTLQ